MSNEPPEPRRALLCLLSLARSAPTSASMKSPVGSRSTTLRPDSSAVFLYGDERSRALRSSWITRLRLSPSPLPLPAPPAPPPASSVGRGPNTISTDESRTPSPSSFVVGRYLSILPRMASAPPPPTHQPRRCPPVGFGPFQLRPTSDPLYHRPHGGGVRSSFPFFRRRAAVHDEDGRNRKSIAGRAADTYAGVHLSPFFQFRPPPRPPPLAGSRAELANERGNTDPPSTLNESDSRPVNIASQWPSRAVWREVAEEAEPRWPCVQHLAVGPGIASSSAQHAPRSRGAAYPDDAGDASKSREILDPHHMHQNLVPRYFERQSAACLNESEEQFSYWNMGRFRRKNTVTSVSVSPSIPSTLNLGRKRNANTDDLISIKYRKLDSDD